MRTFAVLNQKGGVGKTTTVSSLAHAMALRGYKVTAVDMDPQNHLTASFGKETHPQAGIDEVLLGESSFAEMRIDARENLKLLPAGTRLSEVEQSVRGVKGGHLLADQVKKQRQDFVFIDCPPSSGILAMNAILAAKEIIIPVSSDYLALHGMSRLMGILKHVEERLNHKMKVWVVLTRFHSRRRLANEVRDKLKGYFADGVLVTPVREAVALAESPSYGQTIFEYQKRSNGALDYTALADDLLNGRTL
jgi:chromosome partitioning protein